MPSDQTNELRDDVRLCAQCGGDFSGPWNASTVMWHIRMEHQHTDMEGRTYTELHEAHVVCSRTCAITALGGTT